MNEHTKAELPASEALKLVRKLRRGRAFFVMVQNLAPVAGTPDRAFPTCASVAIGHEAAAKFIQDAYAAFEPRGGLVPIAYSERCLWIG